MTTYSLNSYKLLTRSISSHIEPPQHVNRTLSCLGGHGFESIPTNKPAELAKISCSFAQPGKCYGNTRALNNRSPTAIHAVSNPQFMVIQHFATEQPEPLAALLNTTDRFITQYSAVTCSCESVLLYQETNSRNVRKYQHLLV
jgi:hypothetical protein